MNRKMIKTIVLAALMAVPFFAKAQTFAGITAEQNAQKIKDAGQETLSLSYFTTLSR